MVVDDGDDLDGVAAVLLVVGDDLDEVDDEDDDDDRGVGVTMPRIFCDCVEATSELAIEKFDKAPLFAAKILSKYFA